MNTVEVAIGDKVYLIGKMNATDQFHVFRRVMPLLAPILESIRSGIGFGPLMLVKISEDIAKLSDEQLNYVINACMSVVEVQTAGKPLKLIVNGRQMFGDMDLPVMLQITWAVLMENFKPFLTGLLAGPSKGEEPTSVTS